MEDVVEINDGERIVSEHRDVVYSKPHLTLPLWGLLVALGEVWQWHAGYALAFLLLLIATLVSAHWLLLRYCVFRSGSQYTIKTTTPKTHLLLFIKMDRVVVVYEPDKPANSL